MLTLAAGAIFGLIKGTAVVLVAGTLGAAAAFLVARYVARGYVKRRIGTGRLAAVDRALARKGFRLVLLLRLTPVVPYSLLNYSLGLTRVRFRDFLLGSAGMLPGTVLYVYYGMVAGEVAALAGGQAVPHDLKYWIFVAVGLAATIAVSVLVTRTARRALQEESEGTGGRQGNGPADPQ
ncbi:MAG: TVP38/TMEM64 family protein [Gemmatimonadales bacterium]